MSIFRQKHLLWAILLFVASLFIINSSSVTKATASTSNIAPLRALSIFSETAHGQWAGSGNGDYIENNNGSLPIVNNENPSSNNFPSYKINVTGGWGWWLTILAGAGWESYSIEPYVETGALEFNIKTADSSSDGANLLLTVADVVFERNPKNCEPNPVPLSNYVTVNGTWQSVQIPLTDLVGDGSCSNPDSGSAYPAGLFDPSQIYGLILKNAAYDANDPNNVDNASFSVYLNDIRWTSPDSEPVFPPVKVNQLGYTPNSPKYALISGFSDVMLANSGDSFEVRQTSDNAVVYTGSLSLVTSNDAASGEKVLSADFSDLSITGSYVVHVPGYLDSAEFTISETAFDPLVVDSMRYFFYQRQGIELTTANAGTYARGVGHPGTSNPNQDNAAIFESDTNVTRDVTKGWYDAGDYGKYVNAGATALSDLLWAYELFPDEFPDNHLNIPESGNGVPDILDEVRWELEWMLKMQDNDGGFYHMVKSKAPDGGEWDSDTTPDVSPDTRYIRDNDVWGNLGFRTGVKPTSVTASAVAGLAHAAVVYQPIDATFSAELLQAAEDGWTYLQNNNYISTIVGAPYSIPYEDYDNKPYDPDLDDRVWAAAALFRATNDTQYRTYFDNNYANLLTGFTSTSENAYGVGNVEIPAVLMYFAAGNQTQSTMDSLTTEFYQWRDHMLNRANSSVWQHTLQDDDYYWGSNYPGLTTPLALAVGTNFLGSYDDNIVNLSRQSLNYVLGINSMQFSFVSGYGENSLERPFSQMFNFDGNPGVPAGIMVGGANEYNNALLYSSFPAKKFSDNAAAWSTNEHTVYWNAVLVFHAALIAHEADSTYTPPPTPTPAPSNTPTPQPTNTPTATPLPTEIIDVASGENSVSSSIISGDFGTTHSQDNLAEVIAEIELQQGSPGSRYSYVEHQWTFNATGGDSVTVHATAWRDDNSDGDNFTFAWSQDGNNWIDMFSVSSMTSQTFTHSLPNTTSGTLYVRVVDTDQSAGNRSIDQLYVDYLAIVNNNIVVTPTSTSTPLPTNTPTPVPTSTSTPLPTNTPTLLPTSTSTPLPTNTPTLLPTSTSTPLPTNTPTLLPTSTSTPLPTSTSTPLPTNTPTLLPTSTSTPLPTNTPTLLPTSTSTPLPTNTPTPLPTSTSTPLPTNTPTLLPTSTSTPLPTNTPTLLPTSTSTPLPTNTPTLLPTSTSTPLPTNTPTLLPTSTSTPLPTNTPTLLPTSTSTPLPTNTPTLLPTSTSTPLPTNTPTPMPTSTPQWPVIFVARDDAPVSGTVEGSVGDTHTKNGLSQIITEQETAGNPITRYAYLEHVWLFELTDFSQDRIMLNVNAWTNTSDEDSFELAWSSDGVNYNTMFVINDIDDHNGYDRFELPELVTGTLYVRLKDINPVPGNRAIDSVFIDHLFLSAEKDSQVPSSITTRANSPLIRNATSMVYLATVILMVISTRSYLIFKTQK